MRELILTFVAFGLSLLQWLGVYIIGVLLFGYVKIGRIPDWKKLYTSELAFVYLIAALYASISLVRSLVWIYTGGFHD